MQTSNWDAEGGQMISSWSPDMYQSSAIGLEYSAGHGGHHSVSGSSAHGGGPQSTASVASNVSNCDSSSGGSVFEFPDYAEASVLLESEWLPQQPTQGSTNALLSAHWELSFFSPKKNAAKFKFTGGHGGGGEGHPGHPFTRTGPNRFLPFFPLNFFFFFRRLLQIISPPPSLPIWFPIISSSFFSPKKCQFITTCIPLPRPPKFSHGFMMVGFDRRCNGVLPDCTVSYRLIDWLIDRRCNGILPDCTMLYRLIDWLIDWRCNGILPDCAVWYRLIDWLGCFHVFRIPRVLCCCDRLVDWLICHGAGPVISALPCSVIFATGKFIAFFSRLVRLRGRRRRHAFLHVWLTGLDRGIVFWFCFFGGHPGGQEYSSNRPKPNLLLKNKKDTNVFVCERVWWDDKVKV